MSIQNTELHIRNLYNTYDIIQNKIAACEYLNKKHDKLTKDDIMKICELLNDSIHELHKARTHTDALAQSIKTIMTGIALIAN